MLFTWLFIKVKLNTLMQYGYAKQSLLRKTDCYDLQLLTRKAASFVFGFFFGLVKTFDSLSLCNIYSYICTWILTPDWVWLQRKKSIQVFFKCAKNNVYTFSLLCMYFSEILKLYLSVLGLNWYVYSKAYLYKYGLLNNLK